MKKVLPLIALLFLSCAAQYKPIGDVVYLPPAGWEVTDGDFMFAGPEYDSVQHKEAVIYKKGSNQIVVMAAYRNEPFNYSKAHTRAINNKNSKTTTHYPQTLNSDIARMDGVVSSEMVLADNEKLRTYVFSFTYGQTPNTSGLIGVSYLSMGPIHESEKKDGLRVYRETAASVKFK